MPFALAIMVVAPALLALAVLRRAARLLGRAALARLGGSHRKTGGSAIRPS